ncbi:short chain dehydrogenase/reductase family [Tothia fuscella]|uniref:Short chain dehydrogenase/reductase family n=1 Tax=Tothia fuscella TaxID=1048955 RepID=A0A9P4NPC0_9PEZI|nr:short chain dehydrogenase/reductase family [Tothia fuscella]
MSTDSAATLDVQNLFNVKGLVAVVTGGGTGIGLMIAKALALNGASKVYIIGRRLEKLQEAAKASPHGNIIPLEGDITSQDSLSALAEKVKSQTGYIDLLVPNAGIMGPKLRDLSPTCSIDDFVSHAWKTPMSDFTNTYDVNVTGVYYTILAFLALLQKGNERNGGKGWREGGGVSSQIVTVGSIAAFSRKEGASFAYNSSKAGLTHLCKHLSTYFGRWRVRVNVVAPGMYPSEMSTPLSGVKDGTQEGAIDPKIIPETRTGKEEDMAGVILFLAGKAGAYNNGSIITTDGGRIGVLPSSY